MQVIPAEVRLIGEISDEGYRLFADGGWDGRYDDGIEKAKASAQLSIGRIPEVDVLWPKFIESLNEIVMARGPARPGRQFPLVKYGNVKIRHKIFEKLGSMTPKAFPAVSSTPSFQLDPKDISTPINTPTIQSATLGPAGGDESGFVHVAFDMPDPEADAGTCEGMVNTLDPAFDAISEFTDSTSGRDDMHLLSDDDIEGDDDSSSSDELAPEFETANWPCKTQVAREELDKLVSDGKYIGRPLPVFTLNGERVRPSDYEASLKGALVDVTMTITHVSYKQWGFYGDISSIVILAPPGYSPVDEDLNNHVKKRMQKPAHLKKFLGSEGKASM